MQAPQIMQAQAERPKRGTINPQPIEAAQLPGALLTMKTAAAVSGLSVSTLYRRAADDPNFPKLTRIGPRCTRINAGAFMAWLASKADA